jgi:endonuclease YncB( thermonuclease family)
MKNLKFHKKKVYDHAIVLFSVVIISLFIGNLSGNATDYQKLIKDYKNLPIANVEKINDGDTVKLSIFNEDGCRLAGIDTSEIDKKEFYSEEAREFLYNLLKNESVWVEEILPLDKYGRHLVCLYRIPDGLFVNLEIIRQGYGKTFMEDKLKSDISQIFNDYQELAKQANKGIWKQVNTDKNVIYVWKTAEGKKYHNENCRYIDPKSSIKITLNEAKRKELKACKICKSPV